MNTIKYVFVFIIILGVFFIPSCSNDYETNESNVYDAIESLETYTIPTGENISYIDVAIDYSVNDSTISGNGDYVFIDAKILNRFNSPVNIYTCSEKFITEDETELYIPSNWNLISSEYDQSSAIDNRTYSCGDISGIHVEISLSGNNRYYIENQQTINHYFYGESLVDENGDYFDLNIADEMMKNPSYVSSTGNDDLDNYLNGHGYDLSIDNSLIEYKVPQNGSVECEFDSIILARQVIDGTPIVSACESFDCSYDSIAEGLFGTTNADVYTICYINKDVAIPDTSSICFTGFNNAYSDLAVLEIEDCLESALKEVITDRYLGAWDDKNNKLVYDISIAVYSIEASYLPIDVMETEDSCRVYLVPVWMIYYTASQDGRPNVKYECVVNALTGEVINTGAVSDVG